jgi:hypothetical protein
VRSPLLFKKTLSWLQLEGAPSHCLLSPLHCVLYAPLPAHALCAQASTAGAEGATPARCWTGSPTRTLTCSTSK